MADDIPSQERKTGEPDPSRSARAANLFDLRRMIGGLFLVYGLILLVLGLGASDQEIDKAAGVNLNLWVGVSMLALAALFLLWAFTRPLSEELAEAEADRSVSGAHAPVGPDAAAFAGSKTTSRRPRRDRGGSGGQGGSGSEQA